MSSATETVPTGNTFDKYGSTNPVVRRLVDLILVVDRQGTFIRVSPSARAIIGYDPAELVGRSARANAA